MKKILLCLLVIVCAIIGYGYVQKESQIEHAIRSQLAALGLDVTRLDMGSCGLSSCNIVKLVIGKDAIAIENIAVQYSAASLLKQRVDSIAIDSVNMSAIKQAGSWQLDGIHSVAHSDALTEQPIHIPALPFKNLSIKALKLLLRSDDAAHVFTGENVLLNAEAARITMSVNRISDAAEKPIFIPLNLMIESSRSGHNLNLSGTLKDTQSRGLNLTFKGLWDEAQQQGSLSTSLAPIRFDTGMLQPQDMFPVLAGLVTQLKGGIAGSVDINFDNHTITHSAKIKIDNLSGEWQGMRFENMQSELSFSSLVPLLTSKKQTIKIAKLEAGVPLLGGQLQFELQPNHVVRLYPAKWNWSGGSLITDAMTIHTDKPFAQQVLLHVRQIDLQSLLALMLDKQVTAQGRLDGTIPVRIENGHLLIDNASLIATAPGTVIYKATDSSVAQAGGEQTKLLTDALSNFHFSLMSMNVSSNKDGNAVIALRVNGANPDLYGGKAIELNVTLQGRLEEIIKSNMDAYALPSKLEKQLLERTP